ncbi:Trihelix transcription factor [Nymphaea thermarum]|nr:Trihelix transcription factor [Nymphaea thermarum]
MGNGGPDGEGLTAGSQWGNGGEENKPPRLPRWTRQEILVLIQGKRDAEGRGRRGGGGGAGGVEPKWAAISAYCRRHGVDRGPVQCRKRWSNLAGDYRKIKEWERRGGESFWVIRNDARRERRLPGFFDREVYDMLDGGAAAAKAAVVPVPVPMETIFDSGRPAAADEGLFSDFEASGHEDAEDGSPEATPLSQVKVESPPTPAVPISSGALPPLVSAIVLFFVCISISLPVLMLQKGDALLTSPSYYHAGAPAEQQMTMNPEKGSTSQAGQKRKQPISEDDGETNVQDRLIEILERNSRMLTAQLEAQNVNSQLDRNQRKDHTDSLVEVLGKLADALGRIADKL